MIVGRWIWYVKPGSGSEMVALLQETVEWFTPRPMRIYKPGLGPPGRAIAAEVEFESLADYEEFWAKQSAKPGYAAVVERITKLLEGTSHHVETWTLVQ